MIFCPVSFRIHSQIFLLCISYYYYRYCHKNDNNCNNGPQWLSKWNSADLGTIGEDHEDIKGLNSFFASS